VQDAGLAVQMRVHLRLGEDPEGGAGRMESGAQRRSAAAPRRLGGRYPVYPGDGGAPRADSEACVRGGDARLTE
jgi:hypothetical protein